MRITANYRHSVRVAAEIIKDRAKPGAQGHAEVAAGSLAGEPGNLPGPFTLTADGRKTGPYGDLCAALAAHMAWNTRSTANLWHETATGRRKVPGA